MPNTDSAAESVDTSRGRMHVTDSAIVFSRNEDSQRDNGVWIGTIGAPWPVAANSAVRCADRHRPSVYFP
jgi:hypothetical protein